MKTSQYGYRYNEFTFRHILEDKAAANGDKLFLHYLPDDRRFSYGDVEKLSTRVAAGLYGCGVQKGTHVAVLCDNSPEQLLALFAAAKIGAVSVPINTAARGRFLAYYLTQSDATAIVLDYEHMEAFLELEGRKSIKVAFVIAPPGAKLPERDGYTAFIDFRALLEGPSTLPDVDVRFNDLCSIMYTSGTTGPSKGNLFNQIHTLTFAADQAERLGFDESDRFHTCLPLFHAGAYCGSVLTMLLVSGGVALTRRLSASSFWDEVRRSESTRAMLLSVTGFIWSQPASPMDRAHKLRSAIATPVPDYADEFQERFGAKLVQGFGLSDFGMGFSQAMDCPHSKRKSIGKPLDSVEARIVDDDDVDLPCGQTGEILLRHNGLPFALTQGYYKMPEATANARQNLWFHTGDRGWVDEDGYFYFSDRKKDMIRRRGENISAFEVEQAILRHPAVAEVAVYAVPSDAGDEDVCASVNFKDSAHVTELELLSFCEANLPYFMVPRYLDFRGDMPRTMTQKIIKAELRHRATTDRGALWDSESLGIKIGRVKRSA